MKRILIALIQYYQATFRSPSFAPALFLGFSGCRSWPTCSEYAIDALEQYGVIRGCARSIVRIVHCNPLAAPRHAHD